VGHSCCSVRSRAGLGGDGSFGDRVGFLVRVEFGFGLEVGSVRGSGRVRVPVLVVVVVV